MPATTRERAPVRTLRAADLRTVSAGMFAWLGALGVLVGLQRSGAAAIPAWAIWLCVAGFVLGLASLWLLWTRSVRLRRGDR